MPSPFVGVGEVGDRTLEERDGVKGPDGAIALRAEQPADPSGSMVMIDSKSPDSPGGVMEFSFTPVADTTNAQLLPQESVVLIE